MVSNRAYAFLLMIAVTLFTAPAMAASEQFGLPLTLDYPFITTLLKKSFFTGPNGSAEVVNEDGGCRKVTLAKPDISFGGEGVVRLGAEAKIQAGAVLLGRCIAAPEWNGNVEVDQRVWLDSENGYNLRFKTVRTKIIGYEGQSEEVTNLVSNLVTMELNRRLDKFVVNLTPPIGEIKKAALPYLPGGLKESADILISTIRPGDIMIDKESVRADIVVDVPDEGEKGSRETRFLMGELSKLLKSWDIWKVLLIDAAGKNQTSQ